MIKENIVLCHIDDTIIPVVIMNYQFLKYFS